MKVFPGSKNEIGKLRPPIPNAKDFVKAHDDLRIFFTRNVTVSLGSMNSEIHIINKIAIELIVDFGGFDLNAVSRNLRKILQKYNWNVYGLTNPLNNEVEGVFFRRFFKCIIHLKASIPKSQFLAAQQVFSLCGRLRSLDVTMPMGDNREVAAGFFHSVFTENATLTTLAVKRITVGALNQVFLLAPRLTHLTVNTLMVDSEAPEIAVAHLPPLQELTLRSDNCGLEFSRQYGLIASILKSCSTLKILRIEWMAKRWESLIFRRESCETGYSEISMHLRLVIQGSWVPLQVISALTSLERLQYIPHVSDGAVLPHCDFRTFCSLMTTLGRHQDLQYVRYGKPLVLTESEETTCLTAISQLKKKLDNGVEVSFSYVVTLSAPSTTTYSRLSWHDYGDAARWEVL